ncbi:hypothetical protein GCM10027090_06880 [Sinomonas soli]
MALVDLHVPAAGGERAGRSEPRDPGPGDHSGALHGLRLTVVERSAEESKPAVVDRGEAESKPRVPLVPKVPDFRRKSPLPPA